MGERDISEYAKQKGLPSTPDNNGTPLNIFNQLDTEFNFTLDVAATEQNAKCTKYFTEEDNALKKDWSGNTVFCSPPSKSKILRQFLNKAKREAAKGITVVCLVPSRTDTYAFADILSEAEIRFIRGRITFDRGALKNDPAPYGSLVCIFSPLPKYRPKTMVVDIKNLSRPLTIRPVLVDSDTKEVYLFNNVKEVEFWLDEWIVPSVCLTEYFISNSDKPLGRYRGFTEDRLPEILAYINED